MIDEKKLIDEIEEYIKEYSDVDENGYHNLKWCAMMEALDTITRQPKVDEWIPFTIGEDGLLNCKLPEEDEEILVSGGGSVWEDTFMCDGVDCWLDTWGGDLIGLAWMPKPEPWKGEK